MRPLTKELQAKAIIELHEVPERIEEDIKYLREWLSKQKHINARPEDQLLLSFLRGSKFSLERAKEKIDMFYTMRTIIPEFFENRDPFLPEIQEVLKCGVLLPLKTPLGPSSAKVGLLRNGVTDPSKATMIDIFKTNLMIQDILLMEDDHYTIGGFVGLQDLAGVTLAHMTSATPTTIKQAMTCFQEAYPVRPKAMHFINLPSFFETIYSIFKMFMKEKMQRRVVIHQTTNMGEIYKVIPKHVLPNEYGGDAGPIQAEIDYWKKKVESYSAWFKEDEQKYRTNESLRMGKPKTASEMFGVEGSFRKLNVD